MAKRLHGSARTTEAIRKEIQRSEDSLKVLAKRYGINPKTVAKWKRRPTTEDLPSGPPLTKRRKLSPEEEAIILGFREHTLLPLDDCLYSLQARIPHLSRASLHRCFQRHGINRLPASGKPRVEAGEFEATPIGCFHIDMIAVWSSEGPLYLFVAIDQTSKFVFVHLARRGGRTAAAAFLTSLVEAMPFRIHTVLTLDTEQFSGSGRKPRFARQCNELAIRHRLTTIRHPWTSGRVQPMGRMISGARENHIIYQSHAHLARDLSDFVWAYNYRRRLKTLQGLTPHEFICRKWEAKPQDFLRDPSHELVRPENPPGRASAAI